MKVLVCGGRDYKDLKKVYEVLDKLHNDYSITIIVHGAAPGADSLADRWASQEGIPRLSYPAEWEKYKKLGQKNPAGPIRNAQMLKENPDIELAVSFPGGSGTADMVKKIKEKNILIIEIS